MLVTASWQINADTRVNMLHEKLAVVVFRVFLVSFAFFICKCIVSIWLYQALSFSRWTMTITFFFAYTWHLVWQWRNFFPLNNGITVAACCFVSQLHLNLQASCSLLCSVLWEGYANLSIKENSCCCNLFFLNIYFFCSSTCKSSLVVYSVRSVWLLPTHRKCSLNTSHTVVWDAQ